MHTYEVTSCSILPSFKNAEIEVDEKKAAEIRKMLSDSLRKRQPLVRGRDWDYETVQFRETVRIDADSYSVESNGTTAHFYEQRGEGNNPGPRRIASVLNVLKVREVPADTD